MADQIASLYAKIGADVSDLTRGLEDSKKQLNGFQSAMASMQTVATAALAAVGAAVGGMALAVAKTGFEFNAMKEQANIAFTTMLGSGEAAQAMLNRLQDFAAKTPFEFPDLVRATQRMMAMGFSAVEVIPTLTAVGDAVAALGGGQYEIDRVTRALGQMNAKGKTSAEEMLQLAEAGIPAWQMLADKIGVTVPEAMQMVTKGAIDARTTIGAVIGGIEERFGGMMAAQSQTWNGLFSTLKDNFTLISGELMKPFFDVAKTGLQELVKASTIFFDALRSGMTPFQAFQRTLQELLPPELYAKFQKLIETVQNIITAIGNLVRPIIDAIGKVLKWEDALSALALMLGGGVLLAIGALISAMAPILVTFAKVAAAVAALRLAWENDFLRIRTVTQNTLEKISNWFYKESGLWRGSWEKTVSDIGYIANRLWKDYVYYPITMSLDELRWQFGVWQNRILGIMSEWARLSKMAVSNWVNDTIAFFTGWYHKIIDTWNDWTGPTQHKLEVWVQTTASKFHIWYGWVVKYVTDAKDWILEKWQAVLDWWNRNIQPWVDAGRDMILGFWEGVQDAWNRFRGWFTGIWNSWVEWVKSHLLDSHSPSKVFAALGETVPAGLAVGIESGTNLVYDAMDKLTSGMAIRMDGINGLGVKAGQDAVAPFVTLEQAVGKSKSTSIFDTLGTLASDANLAFRQYGVWNQDIMQLVDGLANISRTSGIGDIKAMIDAVVSRLDATGTARTFGAGAKTGLTDYSTYLGQLLTGTPAASATPATSSGGGVDNQLLQRQVDLLALILDVLRKNGMVNHEDLLVVQAYVSNLIAEDAYGRLVTTTAGLRT